MLNFIHKAVVFGLLASSNLSFANEVLEVLPNGNILKSITEKNRTTIVLSNPEGDLLHEPLFADSYLGVGIGPDRVVMIEKKIRNTGGPAFFIVNQSGDVKEVRLHKVCDNFLKHNMLEICKDEVKFKKNSFLSIDPSTVMISLKASGVLTIDTKSGEILERKNVHTETNLKKLNDGRIVTWNNQNNKIDIFKSDLSEREQTFDLAKDVAHTKFPYFHPIHWFENDSFVTKGCAAVGMFNSTEKVVYYNGKDSIQVHDGPGFSDPTDCVNGRNFQEDKEGKLSYKNYSGGKTLSIDSKGTVEIK